MLPSTRVRAAIPESDSRLNSIQISSQGESIRRGLHWTRVATSIGAVILTVVVLDQAAKALVVAWIGPDESYHRWEVAGPWLAFEYVEKRKRPVKPHKRGSRWPRLPTTWSPACSGSGSWRSPCVSSTPPNA